MSSQLKKNLLKSSLFLFAAAVLFAVPLNSNLVFGYGTSSAGVTTTTVADTTVQDTPIDFTSSITSVTGGNLGTQSLGSFSSGDLTNVDLNNLGIIGDQPLVVDKAVTLTSTTPGTPLSISGSSVSNVNISIPDNTTILAPSTWDGTLTPPTAGSSTGNAPSGFSVGGTVIELGSSSAILLFDKPIDVLLTGVTGTVGYKYAGSNTWVQITTLCGGSFASPAAPAFPGECYITNGTDTKIHTYHLTSFASLDAVVASTTTSSSSSNNSGGGSSSSSAGSSSPTCNDAYAGGAPRLISATSTGANTVALTWSKAADPVTHYVVSYGLQAGRPLYGNPRVGDRNTTSYTVGSLSGGQTYYFRVRAGNGCNGGGYSNEVAVRVGGQALATRAAVGFAPGVLGVSKKAVVDSIAGQAPVASAQPAASAKPAAPAQVEQQVQVQVGQPAPQSNNSGGFFGSIFGFFGRIFGGK